MLVHSLLSHLLGNDITKSKMRICCQIFFSVFTSMSFKRLYSSCQRVWQLRPFAAEFNYFRPHGTFFMQEDLRKETLHKQFQLVKKRTNTSHVMQYGNRVCISQGFLLKCIFKPFLPYTFMP